MRMERQTDMTKLVVAFRNFANAPKKSMKYEDINARSHSVLLSLRTYRFGSAFFLVATSPLCVNYSVEIRVNYSRKHNKIFN